MANNIHINYYDETNYYYDLLLRSITPEDFETIKTTLDQPDESYDEHIQSLLEQKRPKEETIEHISEFLKLYPEFLDESYIDIMKHVNRSIETNQAKLKQGAYKQLLEYAEELKEGKVDYYDEEGEHVDEENVDEEYDADEIFTDEINVQVGNNTITIKTYHDPLLIHLYSIIFTAFTAKHDYNNTC
jgi:hypothetical protein